jgi:hypothetical protein
MPGLDGQTSALRRVGQRARDRVREISTAPPSRAADAQPPRPDAVTQLLLLETYRRTEGVMDGDLHDRGFLAYSQTDEDGILLYLLGRLGMGRRLCLEICAGDGIECNTANLIINHGWHGLLLDGDADNIDRGRAFYADLPQTRIFPPVMAREWITRQGVNDIVERHGFAGDIDVLSLDMDGVDYWIWEALTVVTPRIVVLEYQDILGPERAWTVPYSDTFTASAHPMTGFMPDFAGASLSAFVKLGRAKGYRLVGVNRLGFNAFFVREELAEVFPEVPVAACFSHPKNLAGMRDRAPGVLDLPWVEV